MEVLVTPEQARHAVVRWLEVRAAHGYADEHPVTPAEASHSALLARLLSGKEPLPSPPPLSYSYPWYSLIEDGYGVCAEPFEVPETTTVLISGSPWQLVARQDDGFIVTHERTPDVLWRVRPPTDEEIDLAGLRARTAKGVAWGIVERHPDPDVWVECIVANRRKNQWHIEKWVEIVEEEVQ